MLVVRLAANLRSHRAPSVKLDISMSNTNSPNATGPGPPGRVSCRILIFLLFFILEFIPQLRANSPMALPVTQHPNGHAGVAAGAA